MPQADHIDKIAADLIDGVGCAGGCASASDIADAIRAVVSAEREACADKAREFARCYPEGSDGRNTFILLAEHIERRGKAAE